jgi:hypothetical protein
MPGSFISSPASVRAGIVTFSAAIAGRAATRIAKNSTVTGILALSFMISSYPVWAAAAEMTADTEHASKPRQRM